MSVGACGGTLQDVDAGPPTDAAPDAADVQAAHADADAAMPWTVLADNQEYPDAIAVDDTDVYWADAHAGLVMKCSKSGCNDNPTVLASSQYGMRTIALSNTNVYWSTVPSPGPGPVMTCAKSGCGGNPSVAVAMAWPFAMVTDSTSLYWTDKGGQVLKCAPGCIAPVVIASNQSNPVSIAIDTANLYWANDGSGSIVKCALAGCGGTPSVMVSSVVGPWERWNRRQ